jgi:hypothetical protein
MNLQKHIWEGWTVQDFIDDLQPTLGMIQCGASYMLILNTRAELKAWCMDNQPYYKKYIPEVVNYFAQKYNLS